MTNKDTLKYLLKRVKELLTILTTTEQVCLIHCAAGVHRTGTLGYTLLRLAAAEPLQTKAEAYAALKILREDTWKGVGDWRIDLAEQHLVEPIQAQIDDGFFNLGDASASETVNDGGADLDAALESGTNFPTQKEQAVVAVSAAAADTTQEDREFEEEQKVEEAENESAAAATGASNV